MLNQPNPQPPKLQPDEFLLELVGKVEEKEEKNHPWLASNSHMGGEARLVWEMRKARKELQSTAETAHTNLIQSYIQAEAQTKERVAAQPQPTHQQKLTEVLRDVYPNDDTKWTEMAQALVIKEVDLLTQAQVQELKALETHVDAVFGHYQQAIADAKQQYVQAIVAIHRRPGKIEEKDSEGLEELRQNYLQRIQQIKVEHINNNQFYKALSPLAEDSLHRKALQEMDELHEVATQAMAEYQEAVENQSDPNNPDRQAWQRIGQRFYNGHLLVELTGRDEILEKGTQIQEQEQQRVRSQFAAELTSAYEQQLKSNLEGVDLTIDANKDKALATLATVQQQALDKTFQELHNSAEAAKDQVSKKYVADEEKRYKAISKQLGRELYQKHHPTGKKGPTQSAANQADNLPELWDQMEGRTIDYGHGVTMHREERNGELVEVMRIKFDKDYGLEGIAAGAALIGTLAGKVVDTAAKGIVGTVAALGYSWLGMRLVLGTLGSIVSPLARLVTNKPIPNIDSELDAVVKGTTHAVKWVDRNLSDPLGDMAIEKALQAKDKWKGAASIDTKDFREILKAIQLFVHTHNNTKVYISGKPEKLAQLLAVRDAYGLTKDQVDFRGFDVITMNERERDIYYKTKQTLTEALVQTANEAAEIEKGEKLSEVEKLTPPTPSVSVTPRNH